MGFLDTSNCDSALNRILNPDCPGLFASDQERAIYKASNGNVVLYQQAKAQSDAEQSHLDEIHFNEQLQTLGNSVQSIGGKVALGLGIGSGALLVVAGLAAFAYFKLEGKAI